MEFPKPPKFVDESKESIPVEMYTISGFEEANTDKYLRNKDQDELIEKVAEVAEVAEDSRRDPNILIREYFAQDSPELWIKAAGMISWAPEEERALLIRESFAKDNPEVWIKAVEMIYRAPEEERALLIRESFAKDNPEVWIKAVEMIYRAPEEERALLIRESFAKDNPGVWTKAVEMISWAPEEERALLIRESFAKDNPEVWIEAVEMIYRAPEEERALLIRESFAKDNPEVWIKAVEMISWAPKEEQDSLRREVSKKIREVFAKDNPGVWIKAAGMIYRAPEEERALLIREVFEKGMGEEIIKPPLYNNSKIDGKTFRREKFKKTGSGTTLIGGSLKDKIITRHIKPEAFLSWQRLYEDYNLWKKNGFDYVPIEPIQSYKLGKDNLVDVHSGVLDLSLRSWQKITSLFTQEFYIQRKDILAVLDSVDIKHGHTHHDGNFILRFFRDENGKPDITKVPRLYLIDFDQAVSSGK